VAVCGKKQASDMEEKNLECLAREWIQAVVLWGLRFFRLVPGKDVSVMGTDDMPWAEHVDPPLTSVRLTLPFEDDFPDSDIRGHADYTEDIWYVSSINSTRANSVTIPSSPGSKARIRTGYDGA
jgi:hypothetical protein